MRATEILRNAVKDKLARNEVVALMTVRLVRGVEIVQIAKTAGSLTRPGPRPTWRRDGAEHLATCDSLPRFRTPLEARNLPRRPASGSDRRSMGSRLLDRRQSLQKGVSAALGLVDIVIVCNLGSQRGKALRQIIRVARVDAWNPQTASRMIERLTNHLKFCD